MYKYLFIFLFLPCAAMAEFSLYAGVSLSDEERANPEVDLPDPLGILRIEYETEKGSGLNHCGFMIKL